MERSEKLFGDENGSVIIFAMMMLLILTLIGLQATRNTTVELKIAENEAAYRQALYLADAGISFATRLQEAQVENIPLYSEDAPEDSTIPDVPNGSRFQLYLMDRTGGDGDPMIIEIRSIVGPNIKDSREELINSKGSCVILAGMQLPTPQDGPLDSIGNQTTY